MGASVSTDDHYSHGDRNGGNTRDGTGSAAGNREVAVRYGVELFLRDEEAFNELVRDIRTIARSKQSKHASLIAHTASRDTVPSTTKPIHESPRKAAGGAASVDEVVAEGKAEGTSETAAQRERHSRDEGASAGAAATSTTTPAVGRPPRHPPMALKKQQQPPGGGHLSAPVVAHDDLAEPGEHHLGYDAEERKDPGEGVGHTTVLNRCVLESGLEPEFRKREQQPLKPAEFDTTVDAAQQHQQQPQDPSTARAHKERNMFVSPTLSLRSFMESQDSIRSTQGFGTQLLEYVNLARTNPGEMAQRVLSVMESMDTSGMYTNMDGIQVTTAEGATAVRECVNYLQGTKSVPPLHWSPELADAAAAHVADLREHDMTGHIGSNGEDVSDRVRKHGMWKIRLGECIDYGCSQPLAVVVSLLIDDGVPARSHRKSLRSEAFKMMGAAVAEHPTYAVCSVIELTGTFVPSSFCQLTPTAVINQGKISKSMAKVLNMMPADYSAVVAEHILEGRNEVHVLYEPGKAQIILDNGSGHRQRSSIYFECHGDEEFEKDTQLSTRARGVDADSAATTPASLF